MRKMCMRVNRIIKVRIYICNGTYFAYLSGPEFHGGSLAFVDNLSTNGAAAGFEPVPPPAVTELSYLCADCV